MGGGLVNYSWDFFFTCEDVSIGLSCSVCVCKHVCAVSAGIYLDDHMDTIPTVLASSNLPTSVCAQVAEEGRCRCWLAEHAVAMIYCVRGQYAHQRYTV